MRRAGLGRLLVISLISILSASALAFQTLDVRILGARLQRGSDGVLGMKLGLDLQGGSHLVYQARGTKEVAITFQDPFDPMSVRTQLVRAVLSEDGMIAQSVQATDEMNISIRVATLQGEELDSAGNVIQRSEADGIRDVLEDHVGAVTEFAVSDAPEGGKLISVTFQDPVDVNAGIRDVMESVLTDFGKTDSSVLISAEQIVTVQMDTLRPEERNADGAIVRVSEVDGIRQALDERVATVAQFDVIDIPAEATVEQMEGVLDIISRRVNPFGITEPVIQLMEQNRILVQLPGVQDVEEVKRLIGRTAQLVFKRRTCLENIPISLGSQTTFPCEIPENRLDEDTGLTGEDLARAYAGTEPQTGLPIVNIQFNSRGTGIFADLTAALFETNTTATPDRFVILLDDEEIIAPVARQPILSGTAFIEGPDFTAERVRAISIQLESGRLPVPLELVQELDIDATLGAESLRKSLIAGVAGLALVLLFMVIYYRAAGFVSALALLFYAAAVLAVFKVVPITLTLAGIGGFILSIGMAVDANILIFERMKEELRVGRTLASAIEIGFNRAWPAIRDGSVSTIITSVILIWFGQRLGATLLAGFGTALSIGVLLSLFSSVFVSKTLLVLFGASPLGRRRSWYSPEPLRSSSRLGPATATTAEEIN